MAGYEKYAVILVDAASYALKAEKIIQDAGLTCKLIPVPRHLSSDCGICVRIPIADREKVLQFLKEGNIPSRGDFEI